MILLIGCLFSVVFIFLMGTTLGGIAGYALDPGSLMFILLPVAFLLCVTSDGKTIGRYIKKSFGKKPQYDEIELKHISAAAKSVVIVVLAAGCFVFLMGNITLLFFFEFDNPNAINIFGKNLSAGLISLLYAVAIAFFVFYPLRAWAQHKLIDMQCSAKVE